MDALSSIGGHFNNCERGLVTETKITFWNMLRNHMGMTAISENSNIDLSDASFYESNNDSFKLDMF